MSEPLRQSPLSEPPAGRGDTDVATPRRRPRRGLTTLVAVTVETEAEARPEYPAAAESEPAPSAEPESLPSTGPEALPSAGPDPAGDPSAAAVGFLTVGSVLLGLGFAFVQPAEAAWRPLTLAGVGLLVFSRGAFLAWSGSAAAVRFGEFVRGWKAARIRRHGLNLATCPACGRVFGSAVHSPQQLLDEHRAVCSSRVGVG